MSLLSSVAQCMVKCCSQLLAENHTVVVSSKPKRNVSNFTNRGKKI